MFRTTIRLTEEQARRLKELAAQDGISLSELIRRCVDSCVRPEPSHEERVRRMMEVSGKYNSGLSDVSTEHDRYLAEDFQ